MNTNRYDKLLEEQVRYYRARAHEYDEWFLRKGRYDRGEALNRQWFAEVEQVHKALDAFKPQGSLLEIACGTGLWTEQLNQYASHITAIDTSKEVMALNQARTQSKKVQYVQADIFDWQPDRQYDAVFFSFWLSHVPPERFDVFWQLVKRALKPDGRVFFIDSRHHETSTAKNHQLEGKEATTAKRLLNDGREFHIVKVFYQADKLTQQLAALGWQFRIMETDTYFLYGCGTWQSTSPKRHRADRKESR